MKAAQEDITSELNELIEVHNDRIEGYETAAKETNETDLKSLFTSLASHSHQMKSELVNLVRSRGGAVTQSTSGSGKLYRVWMDVKAAVTGKNRKAILGSCEFGEDSALKTYDKCLENKNLPQDVLAIVQNQRSTLKTDHDHVLRLRDAEK
jgi:uncharacterized protein (TIGR02284 family)